MGRVFRGGEDTGCGDAGRIIHSSLCLSCSVASSTFKDELYSRPLQPSASAKGDDGNDNADIQ